MPLSQRPIRHINELYQDPGEVMSDGEYNNPVVEKVFEAYADRHQKYSIICWNCRKNGHMFGDCDESVRSLFCCKCGKPGTTTPSCNICQQRNMENAGMQRPKEKPFRTK